MTIYLRDYIKDNVGPECGGSGGSCEGGGITNPNTLQTQLNECLRRLDRLEAGIGFTVEIADQITLPFSLLDSGKFSVVPTNGTITKLAILTNLAGELDGLQAVIVKIHRNDKGLQTTDYTIDLNHKDYAHTVSTNIPVFGGDWVEIVPVPYTYTDDSGLPVTSLSGVLNCSAILQLPAVVYGAENA